MKRNIKSTLFGGILSDGSIQILRVFSYNSQQSLNIKNIDLLNHPVWTGRRPKKQTEISAFIDRFVSNNYNDVHKKKKLKKT